MNCTLKLKPHNFSGKLIVFEGTDGAGKTTMIKTVSQHIKSSGLAEVVTTRQPTDRVRRSKLFKTMMYTEHPQVNYRAVQLSTLSDRLEHQTEVIIPALQSGKSVICDRYVYTSVANMLARGYSKEAWFFNAARELIKPDAVFFAYAAPDVAIQRIRSRENEKDQYLNEGLLRDVYREFMVLSKKHGFYAINTVQPIDSTAQILTDIIEKEVYHASN